MKVSAIMTTGPHVVAPQTSPEEAMQCMDLHRIRHLPVVEEGRLVGVVSNRDLLQATGWPPPPGMAEPPTEKTGPGLEGVMQTAVITLTPDDSVVDAAIQLVSRSIGCLPVVEGESLVGLVTERDLLAELLRLSREEGAGGEGAKGEADPEVARVMSHQPITVRPTTRLANAIEICHADRVRHLPVVQDAELVGMVSDRDLRRAIGHGRSPEIPVEEIMTRDVESVGPEAPLSKVAERLLAMHFSALPVVVEDRLVGIVTVTDLLDHAMNRLREAGPEDRD